MILLLRSPRDGLAIGDADRQRAKEGLASYVAARASAAPPDNRVGAGSVGGVEQRTG